MVSILRTRAEQLMTSVGQTDGRQLLEGNLRADAIPASADLPRDEFHVADRRSADVRSCIPGSIGPVYYL
jgi:hypothetical protein